MNIQQILVPVDQPDRNNPRIGLAVEIARQFGAGITVLHLQGNRRHLDNRSAGYVLRAIRVVLLGFR